MIYRFFKDATIYALPMFLARASGLFLLPIYTRQLGPMDFGFVELVTAVSAILMLVLPLEINQAIARLLPESDDQSRQKNILASAIAFTIVTFSIFGGLVYYFRFQLLRVVDVPTQYERYVGLACINLLILAIVNLLQVQFRFTYQAKSSVAINMVMVLTNLCLVFYFSSIDGLGVEQYFISQIIAGISGISIGLVLLTIKYGNLYGVVNYPILRQLLNYSSPIVFSSIGVLLSSTVDRIIIGRFIGLKELGYYGVGARLAAIVALGFYVISTTLTPIVYRDYGKSETKLLIVKIFTLTCYCSLGLLLVVSLFSDKIVEFLVGSDFLGASNYIFYLMSSSIFANMYIFFMGMDIKKKTKLTGQINLSTGVLGAAGVVLFAPLFGIWGAVIPVLISNAIRVFGYYYFSQSLYELPIRWRKLLIALSVLMFYNIFRQFNI